ncbi:hypothetical protein HYFRA_00001024 [Hymenoscyphus fraxineus]|uniref:Uncharacterized protein n=1 Tax=Hymenoscyphus fraxineus TaxID=746836 RepID=A0A9N9PS85_9HELO|nr:hypothetical protein HYFRA_00001024 [Hymenoscyphus fraxineus]
MSSDKNQYWIPNRDINKKVITQEIQYYLGPESTVRPYTRDGEDGFLISTPGECLTDEQIDDICRKSEEVWEKQAAARVKKDSDWQLKRPYHQPVVVSRGGSDRGGGSSSNGSGRGSGSSRSHHHHHHRRHSRDRGEGHSRHRPFTHEGECSRR